MTGKGPALFGIMKPLNFFLFRISLRRHRYICNVAPFQSICLGLSSPGCHRNPFISCKPSKKIPALTLGCSSLVRNAWRLLYIACIEGIVMSVICTAQLTSKNVDSSSRSWVAPMTVSNQAEPTWILPRCGTEFIICFLGDYRRYWRETIRPSEQGLVADHFENLQTENLHHQLIAHGESGVLFSVSSSSTSPHHHNPHVHHRARFMQ